MNSTELRSYLTGLILGDGHIHKGINKRAFEIKSINEEWATKIYNDIKSCTNFDVSLIGHEERIGKDGTCHKKYWQVIVKSHPYFAKKFHYFYTDERQRRISRESLNWLDYQGLANWYMSDGYICLVGKTKGNIHDRRVDLCTDRYSKKDIEKLQKFLLEKHGWTTSIIQRKTSGKIMYRLRFSLMSAQDFFVKINPYIVDSMKYKINLKYDYQPKWMTDEYYHLMNEIEKRENPTVITEE